MQFRNLDALVALSLLERKPADPRRVRRWLERSRSDLALARDVVGRVDRDRAMAIAYEAGFRACVGVLLLAGYRLTSQPGHHRAAIEGAAAVLGQDVRPLLRRVDAARQFRNEILYGDTPPASESQLAMLISDVDDLLDRLALAVEAHPNG
jgi:hypothetical protein